MDASTTETSTDVQTEKAQNMGHILAFYLFFSPNRLPFFILYFNHFKFIFIVIFFSSYCHIFLSHV